MAIITNNLDKIKHLDLSIQLSLSGLSFCALNKSENEIVALKDFIFDNKLTPSELLDKLKTVFDTEPALQNSFKNVIVIHDNELSAIVPKALFDPHCLADYLKYNSKILKTDYITFDEISINNSVNVYMPYVNINNYIYDKFGTFTYTHLSTILIEELLAKEKDSSIPKVFINVSNNHFEIISIDKTKLLFYNSFNYTTKDDFIYYLLFTVEQLELNPETLNLIFLGKIDAKHELYQIAYNYIRFVFLGRREDNYKYIIDAQPKSNNSNFALIKSF